MNRPSRDSYSTAFLYAAEVQPQQLYLIVDEFVGQAGTLANLIRRIAPRGGHVAAATVLTGKPYSAKLVPDDSLIHLVTKEAWTGL